MSVYIYKDCLKDTVRSVYAALTPTDTVVLKMVDNPNFTRVFRRKQNWEQGQRSWSF